MRKNLLYLTSRILQKTIVCAAFVAVVSSAVVMPSHARAATSENVDKRVTGKVTNAANGEALPGVSVIIKGTTNGTTTDVNGNYSLNVPDENTILVFSYIGFLNQEVVAGKGASLNVQLGTDPKSLNTVVVVGYGTQKK
ncbi:carboxypeptidase-like regulatory domain-containing protein [Chitinophaga sedimenti]|uniref:carboxypeptidase-like regulatory domain-containing protein n=1 Tax=Chitinophaga sedimenti TaxID=2033606 RepID=UPI002003E21C|nr:carboxypeptidase-like regulatory domain-containing protein [Chitinophaga sedimenti]MCK7554107.1 carboxypeptidase-like regulatory domain-containing protein [Chitinophaga sedimenti]